MQKMGRLENDDALKTKNRAGNPLAGKNRRGAADETSLRRNRQNKTTCCPSVLGETGVPFTPQLGFVMVYRRARTRETRDENPTRKPGRDVVRNPSAS